MPITTKSAREIEIMKYAGYIVAHTLDFIKPFLKPGISTLEIDRLCHKHIEELGAVPNFLNYNGFPNAVCTSVNEVLVHGIPSKDTILKNGDIITIDCGALYKGYHSDGSWTFEIGDVDEKVKQLLEVTKLSLFNGLSVIKPGVRIGDISYAIGQTIKPYGFGIPLDYSGHGIGRNLHEDPAVLNDGVAGRGLILKEGMTFCVEPMVHLGRPSTQVLADGWSVVSKDRSITAHFEHMVVVTKTGYEILTTLDS